MGKKKTHQTKTEIESDYDSDCSIQTNDSDMDGIMANIELIGDGNRLWKDLPKGQKLKVKMIGEIYKSRFSETAIDIEYDGETYFGHGKLYEKCVKLNIDLTKQFIVYIFKEFSKHGATKYHKYVPYQKNLKGSSKTKKNH